MLFRVLEIWSFGSPTLETWNTPSTWSDAERYRTCHAGRSNRGDPHARSCEFGLFHFASIRSHRQISGTQAWLRRRHRASQSSRS